MQKPLLITLTLLFLFCANTLLAWRIEGNVLIIEKGDNLWQIAHALHARGFDYPEIWKGKLDKGLTNNPSLIYDGMRFKLKPLPQQEQAADAGGISKPDTPDAKPADGGSKTASAGNVFNYYGEAGSKPEEEKSSWSGFFIKIGESFFEIFLFPFLLLWATRWLTRHDDERNKKYYLKLLFIFLATLILYALVRTFHFNYNFTSGKIEHVTPDPGIWQLLLLLVVAAILIVIVLFFWQRFITGSIVKKESSNKLAGNTNSDDGAYFEVATIYQELIETITQHKEYYSAEGKNMHNYERNSNYIATGRQLIKRIQSWMVLKGALYLSYNNLNNLNNRLQTLEQGLKRRPDDDLETAEENEKEVMSQLIIIAQSFKKSRNNKDR